MIARPNGAQDRENATHYRPVADQPTSNNWTNADASCAAGTVHRRRPQAGANGAERRRAAQQTVIDFAHPSRGLGRRHESTFPRPVDQTPGHSPGAERKRPRGRPADVREPYRGAPRHGRGTPGRHLHRARRPQSCPGRGARPGQHAAVGGHDPRSCDAESALPPEAWRAVTWRQGVAEPLASRFAALRVRPAHGDARRSEPRPEQWLLVEWPEDEPRPIKFWFSRLRVDRGRYGDSEEGPALGGCGAAVLRPAGQAGQLPGRGVAVGGDGRRARAWSRWRRGCARIGRRPSASRCCISSASRRGMGVRCCGAPSPPRR